MSSATKKEDDAALSLLTVSQGDSQDEASQTMEDSHPGESEYLQEYSFPPSPSWEDIVEYYVPDIPMVMNFMDPAYLCPFSFKIPLPPPVQSPSEGTPSPSMATGPAINTRPLTPPVMRTMSSLPLPETPVAMTGIPSTPLMMPATTGTPMPMRSMPISTTMPLTPMPPPLFSTMKPMPGRMPLADLNPNIMKPAFTPREKGSDFAKILSQKKKSRGDTNNIVLLDLYNSLLEIKGKKDFIEFYKPLYKVLHINVRKETEDVKLIRNNINFKIKNLLESYPHLSFYGEAREFNITRLRAVPEVLITEGDEELRTKFRNTPVGRVKVNEF